MDGLTFRPMSHDDLDAWGDDDETIEAYEDLGFDVVERVQGWELIL